MNRDRSSILSPWLTGHKFIVTIHGMGCLELQRIQPMKVAYGKGLDAVMRYVFIRNAQ